MEARLTEFCFILLNVFMTWNKLPVNTFFGIQFHRAELKTAHSAHNSASLTIKSLDNPGQLGGVIFGDLQKKSPTYSDLQKISLLNLKRTYTILLSAI